MKYFIQLLFFISVCILPGLSWAHPNHLGYQGYFQGFLHPLTGLDHTLAMISVGIIASQKGRYWVWCLPLCFLSFMTAGGLIGYTDIIIPWTEIGITLSVFVLGICISYPNFLPSFMLASLICAFAFCHGYAHGTEIPADVHPLHYALGFLVATALLHMTGIIIGKTFNPNQRWVLRVSGLAMAACAFWI